MVRTIFLLSRNIQHNIQHNSNWYRYDFQVTTLQAILLIRLNEIGDKATSYKELKELTNMKDEILKRVLHSFACSKYRVLLKNPKGKVVKPTDKFKINPKFACPMRSIRVPIA